LIKSADGQRWLFVHPRCTKTILALQSYSRTKKDGQYVEVPEDPQHPHEELVDALRGGLKLEFPESRAPERKYNRKPAGKVF
jgi:hypothetical protein